MIGKTVSHYKILEELGRGGMGIVYRAEDTKLHRTVALKFLPPELTSDASAKERFIHEARAASALDHPNICTIHEIEETADGDTFIVMACYDGETLRERIERGPLGIDEAIEIARSVAEGLDNAHGKAIVHRDIKPANIMLTTEGQVKIMDFGLAKLRGRTIITREGTTLGTVSYMSPEQARGEEIDRRTDIWAFGVLLFEMLTGQRPFKGDYEQAVVYSILNEAPEPLTGLRTGVPLELERIVNRCLDKDASDRYQTAGDLASDLGRIRKMLSSEPSKAQTTATLSAGVGKRRWWPWATAFIAIALLVTVIAIIRQGSINTPVSEQPALKRKMIVVLPFENLGPPEDAYFADGITEEITSRLAVVSGLGVISRTSAVQYDRTGKTLKQIGADLGVDYVLEGTIRWNKQASGGSRIRVTPQLIQVSDDTHLWAETYDRVLEDIFAVQSDIAGRIIEQLGVAMLDREREAVEVKPTDNLLAYEAYLRGLEVWNRAGSNGDTYLRVVTLFQQAVDLDTTFTLAYAKLAEAHGEVYFWGTDRSENRLHMAKEAAERALELEPDLPEAHFALGSYYYTGFLNYDRALREYSIAIKGMPNNAALHASIAYIWRRQGFFQEALDYLEKAAKLDPTNSWFFMQLGLTYSFTKQYERAETYFDRSLVLNPGLTATYFIKALNILSWNGDMERAKATLEASQNLTHPMLIEAMWEAYIREHDYQGALDCLSDLPTGAYDFATTIIQREWLEGFTYMLLADTARAVAAFDSARIIMEEIVEQRPLDGAVHSALGLAYAGLGRKEDAIAQGLEGVELNANDAVLMPEREWELVAIYTILGEHNSALDHIEHLLSVPSWISVSYLKIHPRMDPLRDSPRFKEILEKYSEDD